MSLQSGSLGAVEAPTTSVNSYRYRTSTSAHTRTAVFSHWCSTSLPSSLHSAKGKFRIARPPTHAILHAAGKETVIFLFFSFPLKPIQPYSNRPVNTAIRNYRAAPEQTISVPTDISDGVPAVALVRIHPFKLGILSTPIRTTSSLMQMQTRRASNFLFFSVVLESDWLGKAMEVFIALE